MQKSVPLRNRKKIIKSNVFAFFISPLAFLLLLFVQAKFEKRFKCVSNTETCKPFVACMGKTEARLMALVSIQYVLMAFGMIMASMDLESFDIESVPNCSLPPSSLHVSHTHFKHFAKAMELSTQKADVNELFANTTTTPFVCIDHCKTFITLE